MFEGEKAEALAMLRDIVHAVITFPKLADETGIPVKSLHRMLSIRGNPRMDNLSTIFNAIQSALGVHPQVAV